MKPTTFILLCAAATIIAAGCKKDSQGPVASQNGGTRQAASKLIHTSEEGTVTHANGASITVPKGAVPTTVEGAEGEMLFTIDVGSPSDFGLPATPPAGFSYAGNVCSMGPEGFTFAEPIRVSMPLPTNIDLSKNTVSMFDYDRQTGEWKNMGGKLDEQKKNLVVDVMHLCSNILFSVRWSDSAVGAIRFQSIPGYTFKICIESYTLKYPVYDATFVAAGRVANIDRRDASTTPVDGLQYWRLPQGTYTLQVAVYVFDGGPSAPPRYLGYFTQSVTIDRPHFNWTVPGGTPDYEYAVPFVDLSQYTSPSKLTTGPPSCFGSPTHSVGVGLINVRLEWNAQVDLDLWVFDPCGNKISWDSTSAECQGSIGQLDLDNMCEPGNYSRFVLGRPENIYWRANPPRGTYKVYVHNFNDCSNTGSTHYAVRWWVKGIAYSTRGTIAPQQAVKVTEFTY